MNNSLFLIFIVVQTLWILCSSQSFSVFKSYKDAKVRPKNYARKSQRSFPVEDYLDQTQLSMLKKRQNKLTIPSDTMTDQWSGFDVYKRIQKSRSAQKDIEMNSRRLRSAVEQQLDSQENWFTQVLPFSSIDIAKQEETPLSNISIFAKYRSGMTITIMMLFVAGLLLLFAIIFIGTSLYYSKSLEDIDSSNKLENNFESDALLRDLSTKIADHA